MAQKIYVQTVYPSEKENDAVKSFERLNSARSEIKQYLLGDFDPDKELKEARAERYGSIG